MLWVIEHVFGEVPNIGIEPNRKIGRLLLEEIMIGGNLGKQGEDFDRLHVESAIGRSLNGLKRNIKFFVLGPWEILCSPLWSTWHWCWRKKYGY